MENEEKSWVVKVGNAIVRVAGKAVGFRHDRPKDRRKHPHAGQPLPDPTVGTAPVIVEPGEPKPGDEYGAYG